LIVGIMQSYLDSVYLFLFPLPLVGHYLLVIGSGKYEMSIRTIKIEHRTNSNNKINTKVVRVMALIKHWRQSNW